MSLTERVVRLYSREGLGGLALGLQALVRKHVRRLFLAADYYVYRYPVPACDDLIPSPRLEEVEVKLVETASDMDRLVAEGYEDPREVLQATSRRLASGATGCIAYVGKELASAGWVAFSRQAKESFDPLPYHVDFDCGEACTGGSWTERRFRGRGLYSYVFGHELSYIRGQGRHVCRNAIRVANTASQRGQARYGARLCAVGTLRRVLLWRRWTEREADGACPSLLIEDGGGH